MWAFLVFTTTVLAQTKDTRAELDINGRVSEISVSPNEKIWLVTATGNTYYTQSIDSSWHEGKPLIGVAKDYDGLGNPSLGRISFFNKDTAIMTGSIEVDKNESKYNGFYRTRDGGKTWQLFNFGGDTWIYNVFVGKQGNAWMGGSSGKIYHSKDFGQHWEKLNSPYNSSTRMNSVFMCNATKGISGALDNAIYMTANNWKSSKKIKTPYDQRRYDRQSRYGDHRIKKVLIWNDYIVVNQNGHIYYSGMGTIDWKSFPVRVRDFEIDNDSKTLFAITDSLKIVSFTAPTEFKPLEDQRLATPPIDLKVVNGSLFIVSRGGELYKLGKGRLTKAIPYTVDKKIEDPQIVKQGAKLIWGINKTHVYLADVHQRAWYREKVLDFSVYDFALVNDSMAVLWDGVKNSYLYSLKDHTAQIYFPVSPLKAFLASKIKKFSINSSSEGCFHSINNEIQYERGNDSILETKTILVNDHPVGELSNFRNRVSVHALALILNEIDAHPSTMPSLKDFQINEKDKKNYLDLLDARLKKKEHNYLTEKKKINKVFYCAVPSMLDTLSPHLVSAVFNQGEGVTWSTTSHTFLIQIINENDDTLHISRHYYANTLPWNLPWKVAYKGIHFNCYNIQFSRFINSCISDDFKDKEVFDNRVLIMEIADCLWNKQD